MDSDGETKIQTTDVDTSFASGRGKQDNEELIMFFLGLE